MTPTIRFPYTPLAGVSASLMPRLNLTLMRDQHSVNATGLIDSGSTVNVLPYSIGLALGAVWEFQKPVPQLAGNLSNYEARALLVAAHHPQLTPDESIELIFAWSSSHNAPLLFGQMNFFFAFDVCFFRTENAFEIKRR